MGDSQQIRSFYRVIKKRTFAAHRDLVTAQERRGDPPPDLPEHLRASWDALSFFDTEEGARRAALENPALGKFIARFEIPATSGISLVETEEEPGHYDVRGDKEELTRYLTEYVVAVKPDGAAARQGAR